MRKDVAMLTSPSKPKPTDEQEKILYFAKHRTGNFFVRAYAGCGKTTMLEMVGGVIKEPTLYIVFGKADAEKAKEVMPSHVEVTTINSLGHRVWGKSVGKRLVVDTMKIRNMTKAIIAELPGNSRKDAWDEYDEIIQACGMARHLGYIPNGKFQDARRLCDRDTLQARLESQLTDLAWEVIDDVLFASIKAAYDGAIDFDDQIYMSALFGGAFPRFPNVLLDESQDFSPANHAMLVRLIKDRVGAVGDRWQSIYYFRGAEVNSVDKLIKQFNMEEMPLSVSFRCPRVIVEAARWRVPDFKWINDGGHHEVLSQLDGATIPEGRFDENNQQVGTAIVCRNNAPLLKAAFSLLANKRSVQVAGSDIGPRIIRLLKKIGNEADTREDLIFKIDAWKEEKLLTSNSPATLNDTAECLKVFATWGATLGQAVGYAEHIFKQQNGSITLTTGHKAKGKEWDVVYHLDPHLLRDDDQDLNLKYVITTRARQRLYEVTSKDIQW